MVVALSAEIVSHTVSKTSKLSTTFACCLGIWLDVAHVGVYVRTVFLFITSELDPWRNKNKGFF